MTATAVTAVLIRRIQVEGDSMQPTLARGDRVVAVRCRRARRGALVAVRDPRRADRMLVKRAAEAGPAGVTVLGDNAAFSTDSRMFGPVPRVWGRVVYRYYPRSRSGPVR